MCMTFYPSRNNFNPIISLGGNQLYFVRNITYLGHLLCFNLIKSDNENIYKQYRALRCIRSNVLCRKFSKCSDSVKVYLFKSYCMSFYCSTLWFNYTKRTFNSLKVCYNNYLRMLMKLSKFCSASDMFVNCGLPSFGEFMRKSIYSFMLRINVSDNLIVKNVCDKLLFNSKLYVSWSDILH